MNKKSRETKEEGLNESSSRKRSTDGFAIYSEEELGINKSNAGSTPLVLLIVIVVSDNRFLCLFSFWYTSLYSLEFEG